MGIEKKSFLIRWDLLEVVTMKLKTQVIIISLFQALVDIAGIITAVYFNKIVNSLENTRTNETSNIVSHQQILTKFILFVIPTSNIYTIIKTNKKYLHY